MRHGLTLLTFTLLVAASQTNGAKPNFTGTWKANWSKSKLQIAQPDSTVFTIDHREPEFLLSRTHTFQGKNDTWNIRLTTDGKEVVRQEDGRTLRLRLKWEGDSLVFGVRIEKIGGDASDTVKYSLSRDGKTFTAQERYSDAERTYDNVWVFGRVK